MTGPERRQQILRIAADEFASSGLHGGSTDRIAREAGITQAYIFRIFGTKKALFSELVVASFDRVADGMREAAGTATGQQALASMGECYYAMLEDRTSLVLQLQGIAACGDEEVRDAVREAFGRMWNTVVEVTGLDAVTVKAFLAFGMLLNSGAALQIHDVDQPWANGVGTRIHAGLFDHITSETNR
ncbi:TetR/AcrR family transcriptional regulator [Rhodococcus fascians]|nr:TetR/AcrR family transcriptional regulator [Rhodococcus fascians]MBY3809525.1 TetR/AcrR family transcriptional regulator [Rhodococcus fascians]MBY3840448.1 TetR/AcrR family transcriptional regulator [Rhodococcus fascians]MBY3845862.1 TetR/AcrR family transcriptional regulator [Rhodococcus fascians]MBY3849924.1 TetR/AcrR family transcriptional regulator [Rhodococcus fascians]